MPLDLTNEINQACSTASQAESYRFDYSAWKAVLHA